MAIPFHVIYGFVRPIPASIGDLAAIPVIVQQVTESIWKFAVSSVFAESTSTTDHDHRMRWAVQAVQNVNSQLEPILVQYLNSSAALTAYTADNTMETISDSDVYTAVSTIIDASYNLLVP